MGEPRCIHKVQDGIHELIFTEVSRNAVDEFMNHFDGILRQAAPDDTVRVFGNNGDNSPQPMGYALARSRAILNAYRERPAIRLALMNNGRFANMMDSLFRTLLRRRDRIRFFKLTEREKLLEWLRRDD